jgi:hypothetical protein
MIHPNRAAEGLDLIQVLLRAVGDVRWLAGGLLR